GARAREYDAARRDDERLLARPDELAPADEVEEARRPGERDAGPDDRAPADQDALEQLRPCADEDVVLDDHRARPGRLEHAADRDPRCEMDPLADLGARAHQAMRVDPRPGSDPGAGV